MAHPIPLKNLGIGRRLAAPVRRGELRAKSETAQAQHAAAVELCAQTPVAAALGQRLDAWRAQALGEHKLTVKSCDKREQGLRACTEGALSGARDEQYSEAKFLQVKIIIDRLRGREGLADVDRRWVQKVSDVRNWVLFSASERWRADDAEHEHYALRCLTIEEYRAEAVARGAAP